MGVGVAGATGVGMVVPASCAVTGSQSRQLNKPNMMSRVVRLGTKCITKTIRLVGWEAFAKYPTVAPSLQDALGKRQLRGVHTKGK